MREPLNKVKLETLLQELGRRAKAPGVVYLVGGATAVWEGWRASSIDVDLKLDPEPPGIFEAIAALKIELDVNIELASPDHFIPPVPGWRERSRFVGAYGQIEVYHFDMLTQALAKIERGHVRDLDDVRSMVRAGLVDAAALRQAFLDIEAALIRYPALDAASFRKKIEDFLA